MAQVSGAYERMQLAHASRRELEDLLARALRALEISSRLLAATEPQVQGYRVGGASAEGEATPAPDQARPPTEDAR